MQLPPARRPYVEPLIQHDLGRMDMACPFCGALHWPDERLSGTSKTNPKFGICCASGQVSLPSTPDPPPAIQRLFVDQTPAAKEFREHIRQYNAAFAFVSLGVKADDAINRNRNPARPAPYVFRVHGELCHRIGSLLPEAGRAPQYAQTYIYDPRAAVDERLQRNSNLAIGTLQAVQTALLACNPYVKIYQHAHEVLTSYGPGEDVAVRLIADAAQDRRRYNLPTADDVSILLPGEGSGDFRDIILRNRSGPLHRINECHPAYAPLHYTLLFPHGTAGWYPELRLQGQQDAGPDDEEDQAEGTPGRSLTQTRFYAYQLQVRPDEFSAILRGGRLLQQYIVDMWAVSEQRRLTWLRNNQKTIRASLYSGLEDALRGGQDVQLEDLGTMTVLPSSYTGGARYMQQLFQDGMAIARYFKTVDLFLTMTANPKWPEITRELLPGQNAADRPDLVARVFRMKQKALLQEIAKNGIFGRTVAHIHTIEFQKRGLPHMHLLIFLDRRDKMLDPAAVDSCIRAEWPDPVTEPVLFDIIKTSMVHGPCGVLNSFASCMENGRCTKRFPKPYQESTSLGTEGYPLYRRRDDGRSYEVRGKQLDNRWIVPYSPYLCARYNCHINVECSVSFASLKYINKYIHKGHDRGTIEVSQRDEIKRYIDARYVSAPEGVWRIFHFDLHKQSPNVVRLQVHLPGQHLVNFNPDDEPEVVLARAAGERTMLTAFFAANADAGLLGQTARNHTYQELPQYFTWNARGRRWALRKKGFALGRMYFVSPNAGPRFYLRLLLTVVKGATSFEALRTYHSRTYETFKLACRARGLLEDDGEWADCLQEASEMQTGSRLRSLFATLLCYCSPTSPDVLWESFKVHICDDLRHRLVLMGRTSPSDADVFDYGLYLLDRSLRELGSSLSAHPEMPQPVSDWGRQMENPYIAEQLDYDLEAERQAAEERIRMLTPSQNTAFTRVITSVSEGEGGIFFLNGPGGAGKTFTYTTLCHKVRISTAHEDT